MKNRKIFQLWKRCWTRKEIATPYLIDTRIPCERNTRFASIHARCPMRNRRCDHRASQWGTIDRVLRTWCDQASRLRPCAIGRDADKPPSSLCTSDSRAFICRPTKMPVPNKQRYHRSMCFDHRGRSHVRHADQSDYRIRSRSKAVRSGFIAGIFNRGIIKNDRDSYSRDGIDGK